MTSSYRAEAEKAKNERRAPAPDVLRVKGKKKKVDKPFLVMQRALWTNGKDWVRYRCATREQAQRLIDKGKRSPFERDMWIVEDKP